MSSNNVWINGQIVDNQHWDNRLFSLIVHAPINSFIAGQFTRIQLTINGRKIQRAYSYLNAPNDINLTFYILAVPNGQLTQTLYNLKPGTLIKLTKQSYGDFTLQNIPNCEILWMIATGTAIAPFLSILQHGKELKRFNHIILIHAVRFFNDLNYLNIMHQLEKKYYKKIHIQTILSQDKSSQSLTGYIQDLIDNGTLEKTLGIKLEAKNSHIMLCGNPNMIYETKKILKKNYNMQKHSKIIPGHITTERYW